MTPLRAPIAALALLLVAAPLAAAKTPHSLLFAFNRHALYGPIESKGTLYPAEEKPASMIGRSVLAVIDDPAAGEWLLRLGFDEAKLPASAKPALVRVVRHSLFGWKDVPARLLKGKDGKHALFVALDAKEAVYAVVLGARSEAPPLDDVVVRELDRFYKWLAIEGGVPVTASFDARLLKAIGATLGVNQALLKIVRSQPGNKASAVYHGLLKFFDREPPDFPIALTHADTIYLFGKHLFRADTAKERVVRTLAEGAWRFNQWRTAKQTYLRDWAMQLLAHPLADHPLEKAARAKGQRAVDRLARSPKK